jgi:hypothetical protein
MTLRLQLEILILNRTTDEEIVEQLVDASSKRDRGIEVGNVPITEQTATRVVAISK